MEHSQLAIVIEPVSAKTTRQMTHALPSQQATTELWKLIVSLSIVENVLAAIYLTRYACPVKRFDTLFYDETILDGNGKHGQ